MSFLERSSQDICSGRAIKCTASAALAVGAVQAGLVAQQAAARFGSGSGKDSHPLTSRPARQRLSPHLVHTDFKDLLKVQVEWLRLDASHPQLVHIEHGHLQWGGAIVVLECVWDACRQQGG